ncbi:MAG: 2-hydroxyhepta-2,4-diene-1,7-dioate isomerase [Maribacter sp.]|nr:2-hydroxyhepta-2,4-diene-1,7-dioate isomerase [Maribacter sp.]
MKVYKTKDGAIIEKEGQFYKRQFSDWDNFINRENLHYLLLQEVDGLTPINNPNISENSITPIGGQEIWASGVTYKRSREARMEESKKSGGGSFYNKVYDAERPELFFKSTPGRTAGDKGFVRIRKDSIWNVPEPELTLFICSVGSIEGYTIGNDLSSRSIEGENPLYLPQAKTYDGCAAIGPCIYVPEKPINPDTIISMKIIRNEEIAFEGKIPISNMKRKHNELVEFLYRECKFPKGCFLMTGTGIVPPDDFTLHSGDEIRIGIDKIGVLTNYVA